MTLVISCYVACMELPTNVSRFMFVKLKLKPETNTIGQSSIPNVTVYPYTYVIFEHDSSATHTEIKNMAVGSVSLDPRPGKTEDCEKLTLC